MINPVLFIYHFYRRNKTGNEWETICQWIGVNENDSLSPYVEFGFSTDVSCNRIECEWEMNEGKGRKDVFGRRPWETWWMLLIFYTQFHFTIIIFIVLHADYQIDSDCYLGPNQKNSPSQPFDPRELEEKRFSCWIRFFAEWFLLHLFFVNFVDCSIKSSRMWKETH